MNLNAGSLTYFANIYIIVYIHSILLSIRSTNIKISK
jgi:hypothetical protein